MTTRKMRTYVVRTNDNRWGVLRTDVHPKERENGDRYVLVIGPFQTLTGARYAMQFLASFVDADSKSIASWVERLASKCTCDDTPNSPAACPRHGKGFPP